jgi:hypothetical protein
MCVATRLPATRTGSVQHSRVMPKNCPKWHKSLRHAANRAPLPHHFYTIIAAPANSRRNPQPVEWDQQRWAFDVNELSHRSPDRIWPHRRATRTRLVRPRYWQDFGEHGQGAASAAGRSRCHCSIRPWPVVAHVHLSGRDKPGRFHVPRRQSSPRPLQPSRSVRRYSPGSKDAVEIRRLSCPGGGTSPDGRRHPSRP